MIIKNDIMKVLTAIKSAGGVPYIIGGAVRDSVLGLDNKDIDIEVFGLSPDTLMTTLSKHGKVDAVGKSFGILKINVNGEDLDVSTPRRESKSGKGHKGFIPMPDPNMSLAEASTRRDFTYNAMFYDPFSMRVLDNHHGMEDLMNGITRHVDNTTFVDDPLRVLRLVQFNSRFNFTTAPETVKLCRSIVHTFNELPKERVVGEWNKMMLKGKSTWAGLNTLLETGWICHFPELADIIGVPQEEEWHPEGDVFIHTSQVCDYATRLRDTLDNDKDKLILMYACLCHDLGKTITTEFIDGRLRSRGHEEAGIELTLAFLQRLGVDRDIIESVVPLVGNHLAHLTEHTPHSVRRLANRISPASLNLLSMLVEADSSGRGNLPQGKPESLVNMMAVASTVKVTEHKPDPIVMGRHLIDLGLKPSPSFKRILNTAYEGQLDGAFDTIEGGIEYITPILKNA